MAFDDRMKKRYVELIARGTMPRLAAEGIGVTYETVKRHVKSDPEFAREVIEAGNRASEQVAAVVYDLAVDGSLAAAKYWLENRMPDTWADKSVRQIQITGANGGPIQLATGTVDMWRTMLQDPEMRGLALERAPAIPAIEATAHET